MQCDFLNTYNKEFNNKPTQNVFNLSKAFYMKITQFLYQVSSRSNETVGWLKKLNDQIYSKKSERRKAHNIYLQRVGFNFSKKINITIL